MSKRQVVQTLVVGPLVSLCLLSGCESGHVVRQDKTVRTRSDGTVVKKEQKVTEGPDGTVTKTEKKSVDKPDNDRDSATIKVDVDKK